MFPPANKACPFIPYSAAGCTETIVSVHVSLLFDDLNLAVNGMSARCTSERTILRVARAGV